MSGKNASNVKIEKVSTLRKGFGGMSKAGQDKVLTAMIDEGQAIDDEGLVDVDDEFGKAAEAFATQSGKTIQKGASKPTSGGKVRKGTSGPPDGVDEDDDNSEYDDDSDDDDDDDSDDDDREKKALVKSIVKGVGTSILSRIQPTIDRQNQTISELRADNRALAALITADHKTTERMRKGLGVNRDGTCEIIERLERIEKGIGQAGSDFRAIDEISVVDRPGQSADSDNDNNGRRSGPSERELSNFATMKLRKGVSSAVEKETLNEIIRELGTPGHGLDLNEVAQNIGYPTK